MFQFGWRSHGGQGLGWGPRDVDEVSLDKFQWYLDRIKEQRRDEAASIKAART